MIDYQEIIRNLTDDRIKFILNKLAIPFEERADYFIMPTYCHNHKSEDASNKLYYYKNNKIFMCYTECGSMSIFKFLKNYYESQNYEYDWYNDIFRLIVEDTETNINVFTTPKYHSIKDKYIINRKVELPKYYEGVLDCFVRQYTPEWLRDNITPQTMDKYNILFSVSQNKIIIPHYDINNNLCGIRGRALNQEEIEYYGKYAPVWIEGKCYTHPLSMNLYGLNINVENIRKNKVCYLFESEKSVLQCDSFKKSNCSVAVCGSNFNKFQLNLLLKYCQPQEIIICFDNEEINGDKYFNKLYSICQKYTSYCNFSFVYDRFNLTPKKSSPSDGGESIFDQLLERRVRVK